MASAHYCISMWGELLSCQLPDLNLQDISNRRRIWDLLELCSLLGSRDSGNINFKKSSLLVEVRLRPSVQQLVVLQSGIVQ